MSPRFGGAGGGSDREERSRSQDERERARAEREARRAAREGRAAPEPPPLPVEPPRAATPPPVEPPAYEPEPAPPVEPLAYEAEPVPPVEPLASEPEPEPVPPVEPLASEPEPEPVPPVEPLASEPEPVAPAPPVEPVAPAEQPAVVVQGREDAPVGLKRVAGSALASSAGAQGPPRYGAPPRGIPKRRRGARKIIPLLLLTAVAAVGLFAFRLFEPGADAGEGRVAVTIPLGASAGQIGDLLAEREIVSSSFFFGLRARLDGGNLRSGEVRLKRGMSYAAALAELGKAPPPAPVVAKLTFPEGPGRRDFAKRVAGAGFKGSYLSATRRSKALDPRDYGAPRAATLEGFLFPATYELEPGSSARALVNKQVRTFEKRFDPIDMRVAKKAGLSRYDVLIIASMIEREALVGKDRRLISRVIYNRLEQGIPLGIDATTRYELDNFSRPLRQSELQRDTPYNTRTNQGLPPGPIGNPGLAAMKAAADPARNGFIFYVVKPCENGAHAFSSTDAQFQRDVAAYNAKRDQLGGKDPSQC